MAEQWRYRCPRGHCDWKSRSDGTYYCNRCQANGDDPKFSELVDMKRELIPPGMIDG